MTNHTAYDIQINSIVKTYPVKTGQHVHALQKVSITIPENQWVAIIGKSGSGKSSLLNIIGGLDDHYSGRYCIGRQEISTLADKALSHFRNRTIGFIFQHFNLIDQYSSLDNVALPLLYNGTNSKEARAKAQQLLEKVQISDRKNHFPNQLSGGEKQRVAIARALVNQPNIILADEPTGNLDSSTSDQILALLKSFHKEGKTIIMVTHDNMIAHQAERL